MNQILQVQESKKNSSVDVKKIVLFFAIAIIIFGLIMIGEGVYYIYTEKKNERVQPEIPSITPEVEPTITLTQLEGNELRINISSEISISHIIYNWNDEVSETIEEAGKTNIEEIISIPNGENILSISVIDTNGKETNKKETFIIEASKPVIEIFKVGNDIKITVTSEKELSYVIYKWNSDNETKEDMYTYEDKTMFDKTITIPKGQNTLKVEAVDIEGNKSENSKEIKGVTKAKTTVVVKGNYLDFSVIGEDNIKTVEFEFNGKQYIINSDAFGQTKKVHYMIKMVNGMNYLKIISTTENDAVDTTVWKHEYKISE